jgi:hypothetical protein
VQHTAWLRNTSQRRDLITGGCILVLTTRSKSEGWVSSHTILTSGGSRSFNLWWIGQSTMPAGWVNGRGDRCRDSGGGNGRCAWTTKTWMELTNNDTSVGSTDGTQMDPPKWQWRVYRECGENSWALYRGWLCCPLWRLCHHPCLPLSYERHIWWVEIPGYKSVILYIL